MKEKILIVEDEFILANGLRLMLETAGFEVCELAESVTWAREVIRRENPTLVILDIHLAGKLTGIDLAHELKAAGIGFIYLSASSSQSVLEAAKQTEPYGFLVKPYRQKDVLIAIDIARYRQRQHEETRIRQQQTLEDNLSRILSVHGSRNQKLHQVALAIQPEIPFDLLTISINQIAAGLAETIGLQRNSFSDYAVVELEEVINQTGLRNFSDTDPVFFNGAAFEAARSKDIFKRIIATRFGMQSNLHAVLPVKNKRIRLSFFSRLETTYEPAHVAFLKATVHLLGPVFERLFSAQDVVEAMSQSVQASEYFQRLSNPVFSQVIGKSTALLQVFDHVSRVAPMDTTVLILGESGTGKEKIARSIHELSGRRDKPFVIVNCAALPSNLMESELFGHEKGAFTGAVERRIGKFEQAEGGSIFLDEIGELPIDLQVKLLRTLQEKEVERVGGNKTIRLNVRVIAATNRNLEKEVAEGRFRLDLYYRLSAFPLQLPPLRDRKDDIPLLANHFLQEFMKKSGREINIAPNAMKQLIQYNWPGNIREFQHVIERNALLSSFTSIEEFALPVQLNSDHSSQPAAAVQSMEAAERDHIINALKKSNNRIYGPGGAAELLKLPPTTLASKIKKLGIDKNSL